MIEETAEQLLRTHFLGWQCRIRQHAVRIEDGRPSQGMQPAVVVDGEVIANLTVLINKNELAELVTEFSYMYKKTDDPALRRKDLLKVLVAGYFQQLEEFSDRLTALFSPNSEITNKLLEARDVLLYFNQQNQQYKIPCSVQELKSEEPEYQATFWHNSIFNANLPANVRILAFAPDWSKVYADPLPNQLAAIS
ncbi:MAG: hypothetical protein OEQ24_11560 [Gammaproteobacteria bacterium]|nr:hypothetical protein [Gammaproteobacteria bacterium]